VLSLLLAPLGGETLKVYSEFQRIDSRGQVVAPDRQERSREILSPAVARNAFASYRLAIRVPPGEPYTLYVGQHPENAVRITLYREEAAGNRPGAIPDRLRRVEQPAVGTLAPEEAAHTYWMDLWVVRDAPVRRVKVEAQLHVAGNWVNYPMEVRVMPPIAASSTRSGGPLPGPGEPADAAAAGPLREYLCGTASEAGQQPLTVRGLIRRNALQDFTIARAREQSYGREVVVGKIAAIAGIGDTAAWCEGDARVSRPPGPEWYLRIRDLLLHGW